VKFSVKSIRRKEFKLEVRKMKKLILVLTLLLIATPAFGVVDVNLWIHDTNKVDIRYSCASEAERPRAFALDVNIGGGAKFTLIRNYLVGESNALPPQSRTGYGIYPARITWWLPPGDKERDVNQWGRPEADQNDMGARDQKFDPSTRDIVLEFGSLYFNRTSSDHNEPPLSGTLCTLTVDCNGLTGNKVISAKEEDTYRGGIVLENGTAIDVAIAPVNYNCGSGCTKPGKATNVSPADKATGVSTASQNLTWTAGAAATNHVVYFGASSTPPKVGIVAMPALTYPTGTLTKNTKYYWHVDANNGCGDPCVGTTWVFDTNCLYLNKVFTVACNPTVNLTIANSAFMTRWNYLGKPQCWCCNAQKCGNGIYTPSATLNVVDTTDLSKLKKAFNKTYTQTGYVACVDFNLSGTIDNADFAVLKKHFNKTVTSTGCQ
jgi:hypothetical protein